MAQGVAQALKSMVDGKALGIVKSVPDKSTGFEMWRRLWAEYRPQSVGSKVSLLASVIDDRERLANISRLGITAGPSRRRRLSARERNQSTTTSNVPSRSGEPLSSCGIT